MYNKIDIDVLKEFIEGEVNDIYAFVKKVYYKDMYMTIHDYCFNDLKNDDSIDKYIKASLTDYRLQNRLNKSLKVTDGKYFEMDKKIFDEALFNERGIHIKGAIVVTVNKIHKYI